MYVPLNSMTFRKGARVLVDCKVKGKCSMDVLILAPVFSQFGNCWVKIWHISSFEYLLPRGSC